MITLVAEALGDELLTKVAFVGGCTTGLLVTDAISKESIRYTNDVDLIINVIGKVNWVGFTNKWYANENYTVCGKMSRCRHCGI